MKATLLSRLGRLETRNQEARQSVMQVGSLKKLPDDFVGERHVVVVKRQPARPTMNRASSKNGLARNRLAWPIKPGGST
jgi:hypothetical protein